MTEQNPAALQQQIEDLQRQLAAKRAELGMDAGVPYERAEVHAAVGEQIQQQVPAYQPAAVVTASDDDSDVPAELATQVQELVNVAFTQGVQQAIDRAVKTGSAALLDALHDVLADRFHAELLARAKVAPAP